MKKVLIITGQFLFPLNSGARLRSWNFVEGLRKNYELSLLFVTPSMESEENLQEANKYFKNVWQVVRTKEGSSQQSVSFFEKLKFTPWQVRCQYYPEVEEQLKKVMDENAFDVIFVRYIYQAQYLFQCLHKMKARVFIDLDDIEPRKFERQMEQGKKKSLKDALNIYIFEKYHQNKLKRIEQYFVCSAEDQVYVLNKGWSKNVSVVPNGLNIARYMVNPVSLASKTILFCGVLNYGPNEEGVRWFVEKVLPLIQQKDPAVKLLIVGRSPSVNVQKLAQYKGVSVHADVKDVMPFYEQSSLVVVPLFVAGGTRVKLLEAAACRRPVVATTVGAEGLGLVNRKHCIIEDDPARFAQGCLDLMNDSALVKQCVEENYAYVKAHYDSSVIIQRIVEVFN